MTIGISVKVSEGMELAADSTATIMGWIGDNGGEPYILKTYDHARKLLHTLRITQLAHCPGGFTDRVVEH